MINFPDPPLTTNQIFTSGPSSWRWDNTKWVAQGSGLTVPVSVNQGGTGQTTLAANSVLVGNVTSAVTATPNLTLDGAGNVLHANSVGVGGSTVPAGMVNGSVYGVGLITAPGGTNYTCNIQRTSGGTWQLQTAAAGYLIQIVPTQTTWYSAPSGAAGSTAALTQTMSLDASGNLTASGTIYTPSMVQAQNEGRFGNSANTNVPPIATYTGAASTYAIVFQWSGNALGGGGTGVGSISNTSTTTAYNTTSDLRLKSDIEPIPNAGAIIDALKPIKFTWRNSEEGELPDGYGFAAQEAAQVFPQAVTLGKGSPEDEDFIPDMMDYSKLVPVLTAAIQRLTAKVEELERKLS